jgi:ribosomal protein L22
MPSALHSSITQLAQTLAAQILEAVRNSSLEDVLGGAPTRRGPGRPRGTAATSKPTSGRSKAGRLPRRSADQIADLLQQIVALVKKNKKGLRAEQIRAELGMQPKEMPRVLKEGLAKKVLRTKGQKRATTYFAV